MMRHFLMAALLLVLIAGAAAAVPPESYDQFGNAEEPALRPVKWTLLGLKSLVLSTQSGLKQGAEKSPAAMATEGVKGAADGSGSLVANVAHGVLFSPLPEKRSKDALSYEQAAMVLIEKETAKPAAQDACREEKCTAAPEDPGAKFRQPAPTTAYPTAETALKGKDITLEQSNVQKAQAKYLPLQNSYRGKYRSQGKGDLLRLAD